MKGKPKSGPTFVVSNITEFKCRLDPLFEQKGERTKYSTEELL